MLIRGRSCREWSRERLSRGRSCRERSRERLSREDRGEKSIWGVIGKVDLLDNVR